jgi:hypothetical protein
LNISIKIKATIIQEVLRENLIPGKEYYLQSFEESCLPPNKPYKMIAKFKTSERNFARAAFSNFRNIKCKNKTSYGYGVELNISWRFYEINSHRVQKNMEKRSYNMIILKIVNDEYFTPIDVI